MDDVGLYPEFFQAYRCFDPNPLIEPAPGAGDCEHCRKFLTDLCAYVEPVVREASP